MANDDNEFQLLVKQHMRDLDKEGVADGAFKRLMLTHTLLSSKRHEDMADRLASMETRQANSEKAVETLSEAFITFEKEQIKGLETRIEKLEKKYFVAYGIAVAIMAVPYVPQIFNFFKHGSN